MTKGDQQVSAAYIAHMTHPLGHIDQIQVLDTDRPIPRRGVVMLATGRYVPNEPHRQVLGVGSESRRPPAVPRRKPLDWWGIVSTVAGLLIIAMSIYGTFMVLSRIAP